MRSESLGGGSALSSDGGEVAGRLTPIAIDLRHRRAIFELRVDNGTPGAVAAFAYPLGARRGAIDWHAGLVPAFSAIAVRLDLPYDPHRPEGAVAQILSGEASLTLESSAPRVRPRSAAQRVLIAACAIGTMGSAGAVMAGERPAIVAFAAPERVPMGRAFDLVYATAQANDVRYFVRDGEGIVVRRGNLAGGTGSFSLDLPILPQDAAYDVVLDAGGTFGSDRRIARIETSLPVTTPAPRRARVDAFALESDTVASGTPIVVNYRATARSGVVALLDQDGTERAVALLSHRGRSVLIAPAVDRDQEFRVVLTASGWKSSDTASAPVHVTAMSNDASAPVSQTVAAAPAQPSVSSDATTQRPVGPVVRGPIGLGAGRIVAGRPFIVDVLRRAPGVRIAIDDADGTELAAVRPKRGTEDVVMRAPSLPATYTLVATFARGVSEDSFVLPLTVTPSL